MKEEFPTPWEVSSLAERSYWIEAGTVWELKKGEQQRVCGRQDGE